VLVANPGLSEKWPLKWHMYVCNLFSRCKI